MKVQGVTSFGSTRHIVHNPETSTKPKINLDNDKIETCLNVLGAIGIAGVFLYAGQKGFSPIDSIKNTARRVSEFVTKPQDPISKVLKGRRDAKAVELYKKYTARQKFESLQNRIARREFDDKPAKALHKILDNVPKLQEEAFKAIR